MNKSEHNIKNYLGKLKLKLIELFEEHCFCSVATKEKLNAEAMRELSEDAPKMNKSKDQIIYELAKIVMKKVQEATYYSNEQGEFDLLISLDLASTDPYKLHWEALEAFKEVKGEN